MNNVSIDKREKIILYAIKKYWLKNAKIISKPCRFLSSAFFSYVADMISKYKREKSNLIYYILDDEIY